MLLTRESDYALRVLRSLLAGEQRSVGDISKEQMIPQQFAYRIIKKLSLAGLVEITRGASGGCRLSADLTKTSLYDLMTAMEGRCDVNACMESGYHCPWREKNGGCCIHTQLSALQTRLDDELRAQSLMALLTGVNIFCPES